MSPPGRPSTVPTRSIRTDRPRRGAGFPGAGLLPGPGLTVEPGQHLTGRLVVGDRDVPADPLAGGRHGEVEENAAGLLPAGQVADPVLDARAGAEPEADRGGGPAARGQVLAE